ncbi:MAG: 16S rRNA (cytosine(1402)-N(4))-methyltransferase RsmH [Chloroflexota bacterium]|nr:16S rRNA (cytosine(1402)-N(4))-methyltransferase RsmH [Chloroflexota bacterium]
MSSGLGHRPVLLAEAVAALRPRPGGVYLDGTIGGGGHTRALLEASAPDGQVIALDADPAAALRAEALALEFNHERRFQFLHGNFADLSALRERWAWPLFDGVLLDLGLSSFQLDDPARGFAFRSDGPLDMRFDPTAGASAADLVRDLDEKALASLLFRFGEEPRSRQIARAIVREREREPISTTSRLATVVERAVGGRRGAPTHPATRTFQALRIAVNGELQALKEGLAAAIAALAPNGRLAVIAFHSLEDRIVKQAIAAAATTCVCPPAQPICTCETQPLLRKVDKAIRPSEAELAVNPRARSAIMRIAERTDVPLPAHLDPPMEGRA